MYRAAAHIAYAHLCPFLGPRVSRICDCTSTTRGGPAKQTSQPFTSSPYGKSHRTRASRIILSAVRHFSSSAMRTLCMYGSRRTPSTPPSVYRLSHARMHSHMTQSVHAPSADSAAVMGSVVSHCFSGQASCAGAGTRTRYHAACFTRHVSRGVNLGNGFVRWGWYAYAVSLEVRRGINHKQLLL